MMDKNINAGSSGATVNVTNEIDVDRIIEQLLSVKETPGKQVTMFSLLSDIILDN